MFVPYGTDAPIYHWPIATGVLMLINIMVFPFQMAFSPDEWINYALSHGEGLHPVQWLTSFFMHGGLFHLLGNMLFLFAFGVIVEGKVGPLVFTVLYFAMGIIQNMIEQILYLGTPAPPSLGASSVIYALMMISMFWAPKDNIKMFVILIFYPFVISIPVLLFSFFYFFVDFGSAMFGGFEMSTPVLHVMGAAVGFVPAVLFLKKNWVDCEQHDLFSMFRELSGKEAKPRELTPRQKAEARQQMQEEDADRQRKEQQFNRSIITHLDAGNADAAVKLVVNYRRRGGQFDWSREQLLLLIRLFQKEENWSRVVEFSTNYIKRFSTDVTSVQINLAKVYLLKRQSPRKAIKILQNIEQANLKDKEKANVQTIYSRAKKEIDEGHLELGD